MRETVLEMDDHRAMTGIPVCQTFVATLVVSHSSSQIPIVIGGLGAVVAAVSTSGIIISLRKCRNGDA